MDLKSIRYYVAKCGMITLIITSAVLFIYDIYAKEYQCCSISSQLFMLCAFALLYGVGEPGKVSSGSIMLSLGASFLLLAKLSGCKSVVVIIILCFLFAIIDVELYSFQQTTLARRANEDEERQ